MARPGPRSHLGRSQAPHAASDAFQGLNLLKVPHPLEAVNPTLTTPTILWQVGIQFSLVTTGGDQ
jgi:hypothetical protein